MRSVKIALAALIGLCLALEVVAQEQTVPPAEILQSVQQWMQDNVDDSTLEALGVDGGRVHQFLDQLRARFQGSYVYDLGGLRETATNLLPVLQQFEETQPYADWLQTHLDYFEVAQKLQRQAAAPKPGSTDLAPPSPKLERSVWVTELEKRPFPPNAEKYLPGLKRVFLAEKVPPELVWLAEVESSFNPRARSPVGAAGMFQLMPATARELGLSTWLPDERLNPEKSAGAAARYLRRLHDRLGDWRLAFAAYNAGEGRVAELLKKQDVKTFDAIAGRLPAETQMYVPKIEATLRRREGVALSELKGPKI
jgi:membrane-bound lytic murein transglycosylase D